MAVESVQLLRELRAHRRGAALSTAVAQHLSGKLRGYRADPTARGLSFDAWCASLGELNLREKILATSVRWALTDPHAKYVEPTAP